MRGQPRDNARPHARLPPSFLGIDDLSNERSFASQATRAIDVQGVQYLLICFPWASVEPGADGRPVDCCRN